MRSPLFAAALGLALWSFAPAGEAAVMVTVPGTANPYLAGMPDGSTASLGDVAPDESPVLVTGIDIAGGVILTFAATGTVSHGLQASGPEGGSAFSHFGSQNGIANVSMPINALLGVFLGDAQPDASPAPSVLDFITPAARDFAALAPGLKQPFFIGDGQTSGGDIRASSPRPARPGSTSA